jgi:hypothetical protein
VLIGGSFMGYFLQVGWDESTAGERQQRVSIWDIEPLTTPFLLYPPPLALRSKRARGGRGKLCESGVLYSEVEAISDDMIG